MVIYLYLKTHNKTGLKYLGKTTRNPYTYHGSGKRWKNHIKVHGKDISTEILFQTEDETLFKLVALCYSKLLDIVRREDFANLIDETGEGGDTMSGRKHRPESIAKMKSLPRKQHSPETCAKISQSKTGAKISPNKHPRTEKHRKALSESLKGREVWNSGVAGYKLKNNPVICPHCNETGKGGGFAAWHFDNCLSLENSKRKERKVALNDNIYQTTRNNKPAIVCSIMVAGVNKRKACQIDQFNDIEEIYKILREWRDTTLQELGITILRE